MANNVKPWLHRNVIAYSVPIPNNGDDNRSAVAWVVMKYNPLAKAYHLFCLEHKEFLCHCAMEAVNYRNNFGANDDAA